MTAEPRPRLVLGIETSCDETAAAVVEAGRIVHANVVASQAALHAPFGGVFPEVASRQHVRDVSYVVEAALDAAQVRLDDIDALAVTNGPGLAGALLVGVNAAKGLALATGTPLVGVHHLAGHLASQWLHAGGVVITPAVAAAAPPPPPLPHLALIVSGGHTELLWVRDLTDVTRLAQTRDDAAGEAFDKAARLLGLGYPGGPAVERAAAHGDPDRFALPVARTDDGDWSFSGLKTALARQVERLGATGAARGHGAASGDAPPPDVSVADAPPPDLPVADLAASFQAAIVRALVERLRRAHAAHPGAAIAVSGGVSANTALRSALAAAFDVPVWCPPLALCTDNAAMIAAAAWHRWTGPPPDGGLGLDVDADATLG